MLEFDLSVVCFDTDQSLCHLIMGIHAYGISVQSSLFIIVSVKPLVDGF